MLIGHFADSYLLFCLSLFNILLILIEYFSNSYMTFLQILIYRFVYPYLTFC